MEASPLDTAEPLALQARGDAVVEAVPCTPLLTTEPSAREGPTGEPAVAPVAGSARIDALTGLRFLFALLVLLSHVGAPPTAGPLTKSFFESGYVGVTLFFVLSGFVLTHNYYERFASGFGLRQLRSFLVARIARIYPLYLVLLVWVAFPALSRGQAQVALFLEHAIGLQAWEGTADRAYAFNGPGWSVSVEIFLYGCFPLLILALAPVLRTQRRVLVAAGVVTFALAAVVAYFHGAIYGQLGWTDPRSAYRWLYRFPPSRLGDFMLGILGARLLALRGPLTRRQAAWLVGASAAVIVGLMTWPTHCFSTPSWDLSCAVPAAFLIFGLAASPLPVATRWLSSPAMLLLGDSSYALYLCHRELLPKLTVDGLSRGAWFFETALIVLLVTALAVGLHIVIERPARTVVRRWLDARPARSEGTERPGTAASAPRLRFPTLAATVALAALMPLALLGFRLADGQPRDVVTFDHLIRQAAVLIDRKQPSESLAVLARAERMNPNAFALHLNRCVANGLLEQRDAAVAACRRAVRLDPRSSLARNDLAWVEGLARHEAR